MKAYLDNSATTKPHKSVVDIMVQAMTEFYGNPSSLHRLGVEAEKRIKSARRQVAKAMGSKEDEIVFTSGGTESNNLAILGSVESCKKKGNHIITSKIEHPSVLQVFKNLETKGFDVTYLDVDEYGTMDMEQFKNSLCDKTILVSIMHVNNEAGTIQPVQEINKLLRGQKEKPVLHVDAIQSFCKIKFSPEKLGADLLSISGHKIHGPKGVGALYVRKGTKLTPFLYGGNQETGMRSGTENVPGILGLGKAAEESSSNLEQKIDHLKLLKKRFTDLIIGEIESVKLNGFLDDRSAPHIVNISFLGIRGEVLLHTLEQDEIFVSTGSACSSRKNLKSHVLQAMKLSDEEIEGAVRFSFSYENTMDEIDFAAERIKHHVKDLRKIMKR
ncbi:MAG: cysteine desulfurase family protein [Bacillota bacterium]